MTDREQRLECVLTRTCTRRPTEGWFFGYGMSAGAGIGNAAENGLWWGFVPYFIGILVTHIVIAYREARRAHD